MSPTARNVSAGSQEEWETIVEPYAPTFPFENEGDVISGQYLSVKEVEQDDLARPGEKRMVNCYEILSDSDQTKYSVWGTHSIDEAFHKGIEVGSTVRIVFQGKIPIKGGAQTVNQFVVQRKRS